MLLRLGGRRGASMTGCERTNGAGWGWGERTVGRRRHCATRKRSLPPSTRITCQMKEVAIQASHTRRSNKEVNNKVKQRGRYRTPTAPFGHRGLCRVGKPGGYVALGQKPPGSCGPTRASASSFAFPQRLHIATAPYHSPCLAPFAFPQRPTRYS